MILVEQGRGSSPRFLNFISQFEKQAVQRLHRPRNEIGGIVFPAFLVGTQQLLEERRIDLCAPIILRPDVIEVSAVGQRVLGDNIHIPPIELLIELRLAFVRDKTVAKDHVSWAKAAGISAAEKYGVLGHFGIQRFAIRPVEWRGEHIVTEPITKPVVPLLIIRPMSQDGMEWH